jgi:hypothetical protein
MTFGLKWVKEISHTPLSLTYLLKKKGHFSLFSKVSIRASDHLHKEN